ncbi:MAG: glutamate-5-semialdehyde dehydrogenase [Fibrobacter sp.]|nr:glutamate-5-semialdehyde dehydrogenase [Fibrobacter sp.]
MIDSIALEGRKAALELQSISAQKITEALQIMAKLLENEADNLKIENRKDLDSAKEKGLSSAMIDRLTLSDKAIKAMINGLNEVAQLKSPVGTHFDERIRPNGTRIYKMRVPIGVVGIIYESRPNVTIDAAAICLKSHNAVILRGGSEAIHSNMALASLFSKAILQAGLPKNAVQIISTTDRKAIELLLTKNDYIDLIIPRGGEGLIRMVTEKSHIPVIKHYNGICHIYVAADADMKKAVPVIINSKVQRPGTCNAIETLLLDVNLPQQSKLLIIEQLLDKGVTLFADPQTTKLSASIKEATEESWRTEYLDLRLSVRTVDGLQQAIDHINTYGSHHTDSILTESKQNAEIFLKMVDSASVMVNASTRLADGGEYGMGCEIGISTEKLHARGPMGVEDLTTYKWIVEGEGQIRT